MFESVRGLSVGLAKTGNWRVTVVACEDRFSDEDSAVWGKFGLRLAPRSRLGIFNSARRMTAMIRDLAPDVVHLHGVWGPASLSLAFLSTTPVARSPAFVLSPRGMFEPWALARSRVRKAIAWRAWMKRLADRAEMLHALCAEEAASLHRLVPSCPVTIVPNGVDLPAHADKETGTGGGIVLFLGRLHPKKGLSALLDAWATIAPIHRPAWKLVIAGWDGDDYETTLKVQSEKLGLGNAVTFFGPAFGAEKERLLRSASLFVLPSFSEGLPMAVLEAWSYGVPVLMTDECHLPEGFSAGAAMRIDPTHDSIASGISAAIERMTDDERRRMGARGRALVEQDFTWDRVGVEMASLYDRIASEREERLDRMQFHR